ncbi:MAG: divergent polysaccharide deacetylase family protein [Chloroflexi bacterium]|nr:divergent polysaccharide deacetylase family protein [Chloroflexota bacterium]
MTINKSFRKITPGKNCGQSGEILIAAIIFLIIIFVIAGLIAFIYSVNKTRKSHTPVVKAVVPVHKVAPVKVETPPPEVTPPQAVVPKAKPTAIKSPVALVMPKPLKYTGPPRIVIIIDDFGNGFEREKAILDMPYALNISVIPDLSKSKEMAGKAHETGKTVLIHLPMESFNAREKTPLRIMTGMSFEEIKAIIEKAQLSVPYAVGANNHEGSKATSDEKLMGIVLKDLKDNGLFFVDSATSSDSRCLAAAAEVGIPFGRRQVFLDNVDDPEYVKGQIEQLKRIARERGFAVAIGHPRRGTVEALKKALPELESEGFELVSAKDIVSVLGEGELNTASAAKEKAGMAVKKSSPGKGVPVIEYTETETLHKGEYSKKKTQKAFKPSTGGGTEETIIEETVKYNEGPAPEKVKTIGEPGQGEGVKKPETQGQEKYSEDGNK